jgi:hypothetical protein
MSSLPIENTMNNLFCRHIDLSQHHIRRLACVSTGLLLAGSIQMSRVARWLRRPSQQKSRVQFLRRLLSAPYFNQQQLYQPLLRQALRGYQAETWHLIIDRTHLASHDWDLLMVSLNFRKRAIPLAWQGLKYGSTTAQTQISLLKRVVKLIPKRQAVVWHGDSEFGSVPVMKFCQQQGWNFIFGQSRHTYYRSATFGQWHYLGDLRVTPRHPVYLSNVLWTKAHQFGPLNLFAFYAPRQHHPISPRRDIRYCVTSLPIAHTLRRVGHRRWGTEGLFRDYKSSGWQLDKSALQDPQRRNCLLLLLSINYLWLTCLGRWLCKVGHRHQIDPKTQRHFSLFRIGWDWLIHQHVLGHPIPPILTLYA